MMTHDPAPARERLPEQEGEAGRLYMAARVRVARRARRDARSRAARVRRALLAPTAATEMYVPVERHHHGR